MESIWIVRLEVFALTDQNPGGVPGFINVVASAPDVAAVKQKVRECLDSYEWQILEFEAVDAVNPDQTYNDDMDEHIEDVISNPEHVRLLTLHTYKVN